jgi:hypothetical protein
MVQPSASRGPVPGVVIEDNFMDYGSACLNMNPTGSTDTVSSVTVRRNRFGRHGIMDGTPEGYRILAGKSLSCPGLPTTSGPDTAGNVYADDGTPVPVRRP